MEKSTEIPHGSAWTWIFLRFFSSVILAPAVQSIPTKLTDDTNLGYMCTQTRLESCSSRKSCSV